MQGGAWGKANGHQGRATGAGLGELCPEVRCVIAEPGQAPSRARQGSSFQLGLSLLTLLLPTPLFQTGSTKEEM